MTGFNILLRGEGLRSRVGLFTVAVCALSMRHDPCCAPRTYLRVSTVWRVPSYRGFVVALISHAADRDCVRNIIFEILGWVFI